MMETDGNGSGTVRPSFPEKCEKGEVIRMENAEKIENSEMSEIKENIESYPEREEIEWCNYYARFAHRYDVPRILLIGDSITNSYNGKVFSFFGSNDAKPAPGDTAVDVLVSSYGINDPMLDTMLKMVLEDGKYRYSAIHFNNGLHPHDNPEGYERGLRRVIGLIRGWQPQAKLILATSTHVTPRGGSADCLDLKANALTIGYNDVVRKLAEEYSLPLDDLWTVVAGRGDCPHTDGIHFGPEGVKRLTDAVVSCLKANL